MKVVYVITCEVPDALAVTDAIVYLDPPRIPHFAGTLRVVIDPEATELENWLDEE